MQHPLNRKQRQLISAKKIKPNVLKKEEQKDRPSKVWRKRTRVLLQEKETADELREWVS